VTTSPLGGGDTGGRLARVASGVSDAVRSAGRDPAEITTIVVTKFHPASLVRELYDLGVRDVGENRHQEAQVKSAETADLPGLRWHFVGQLQSKKARQARRYAAAVHSLDRSSVVDALGSDDASVVDGFVQVNLTDDPGRGGVPEAEVDARLRAPAARVRAGATGCPGGRPDLGGHVRRLRRRDRRGRDTPAHRHGNHGFSARPSLMSV
jgi:uncharacterized pyridoxal phosphate-containing UPF0001 family protein